MVLGLGARLALATALLAALTAVVTAAVSAYSTDRQVNAGIDDFLGRRAIAISRRPPPDRPDELPNSLVDGRLHSRPPLPIGGTIGGEIDIVGSEAEVQILDAEGRAVLVAGVELPITDVERSLLTQRDRPQLRTVEIGGEPYRLITQHRDGGGVVQVAMALASTNLLLGELRTELLAVGLTMSALAGLGGWLVASRTTKPLRRLIGLVENVAETQDLSMSVGPKRADEVGRLSAEFETLLKTLDASRKQQKLLVQDAAHELRTPLTSVRANIDFLERAPDLDDAMRRQTLTSIKSEVGELSTLIAEVVELAGESHGTASFEEVDLASVAEAAVAQFELRSTRSVVRNLTSCAVRADHAMLTRAASNLIGNAEKYSPAQSPIEVTVTDGSLWVSDHGPGIDPIDRGRVFDRFYRSDGARSAPGSGLGLAIVAKVVADHEGEVWVRTSEYGGAEVGMTLPSVRRQGHGGDGRGER